MIRLVQKHIQSVLVSRNYPLKGAESQPVYYRVEPRKLQVENQASFQALPGTSSGTAQIQGPLKNPPAKPNVRCTVLISSLYAYSMLSHKHTTSLKKQTRFVAF